MISLYRVANIVDRHTHPIHVISVHNLIPGSGQCEGVLQVLQRAVGSKGKAYAGFRAATLTFTSLQRYQI